MPYENDKNKDTRSDGKKSVTRKSGTTADARQTANSRTQNSKPKSTGSSSRSGSSTGTSSRSKAGSTAKSQSSVKPQNTAKPRSGAKSQSAAKSRSTAGSGAKPTESTRNRADSTAREDYRRFSEDIKNKSQAEKREQAKKTQQKQARSDGKKGKSHSRSKLLNVLTYIMIVFAFVALMVTLSLTVFFKTDNIDVSIEGAGYYSEEKIVSVSGIKEGQNIFSIDIEAIEADVEAKLPYIEKCEIKRVLPTEIRITAISAEPAGVVTLQTGARIVVSAEGKTLELLAPVGSEKVSDTNMPAVSGTDASATDMIPSQTDGTREHSAYTDETLLPEITGLEVSGGMEIGAYIETEDETAMATLEQLTELLHKYNLPPDRIDLSAGNLYVYYDDRIMIKLGSGYDLEMKIELAGEIILNKLSEYDSGRVDVSSGSKGYFTPEYMLNRS